MPRANSCIYRFFNDRKHMYQMSFKVTNHINTDSQNTTNVGFKSPNDIT